MSTKNCLFILLLLCCLSACTVEIPDPSEPVDLLPHNTPTPVASLTPSPSSEPSGLISFSGDASGPSETPHDNYRQKWEDAYGIPEDVPQLAYGISEVAFLNQGAVVLRWSIINDADIESVCKIVEEWTGHGMQYSEGTDKSGNPTRIWKNDTEKYFLQFTVSQRDEPYPDDGSILKGEMMISTLQS